MTKLSLRESLWFQPAYHKENYGNVAEAYKEFIRLNKSAAQNKTTDMRSINSFLRNIYMGGDHDIPQVDFLKYLIKKDIQIKNKKTGRL
jgi:hypothetical protein